MHRGKKSQKTEIYLCKPVMIDQPRGITAQQSEHARIQWLAVFLPMHPMVGSFLTTASNGWQFSYHCIQWLVVFLPLHPMVGSFLTTTSNGWQFSYHCIQWLAVFLPQQPDGSTRANILRPLKLGFIYKHACLGPTKMSHRFALQIQFYKIW